MSRFSRKHGGARLPLAFDDAPRHLRHGLWTVTYKALSAINFYDQAGFATPRNKAVRHFFDSLCTEVLEIPLSARPNFTHPAALTMVEHWFYEIAAWHQVYDLIDFMVVNRDTIEIVRGGMRTDALIRAYNEALADELSPWRFANDELVLVGSDGERQAVEEALKNAPELVREHLDRALRSLDPRGDKPDVHGAIAEAVNGIESMAKHVLNDAGGTYGKLRQSLEKRGVHKAFVHAFDKLYGYASDEGGLRHAFKPGDDPTKHVAEGRMFVVMASAYINYMLEFYSAPMSDEEAAARTAAVIDSAKAR